MALQQQAVAAGSSSMDVFPLAAVFGSHFVPEMQWVVSSLDPFDVARYMESQRELSLRDAVCSTEHRTMPDRIWIAITFRAFADDSGARYPVNAHVTLGRFEIQNDQDVTEVIAAAQRACNVVNARLRRLVTRSNLWSARTCINEDASSPMYVISDIVVHSQLHSTLHGLLRDARCNFGLLPTRDSFHLSIEPLE